MKQFQIWMEGFAATGQSSGASLLNDGSYNKPGLILANTFDEAVEKYMELVPGHGISPNLRNRYGTKEAFESRKSNWNIWACNLYPTEREARESFG